MNVVRKIGIIKKIEKILQYPDILYIGLTKSELHELYLGLPDYQEEYGDFDSFINMVSFSDVYYKKELIRMER